MNIGDKTFLRIDMFRRACYLSSNLRTYNRNTAKFSILLKNRNSLLVRTVASSTRSEENNGREIDMEVSNDDLTIKILDLVKLFEEKHNEDGKVVNYLDPSEVPGALGGLDISKTGMTLNDIKSLVDNAWKYSIKTRHKHFYNALYHGVDTYGMAGGILSEALNTNCYSHEVAPVFSATEGAVIKYFGTKFGWEYADGLTTPGGSISNM